MRCLPALLVVLYSCLACGAETVQTDSTVADGAGDESDEARGAADASAGDPALVERSACSLSPTLLEGTSCIKRGLCAQPVEAPDGTVTMVDREASASCDDSTGELVCTCGDTEVQFAFSDSELEAACDTTFELCASQVVPVFDSEPVCTSWTEWEKEDGCHLGQNCRATATVAPGAVARRDTRPDAQCLRQPDDTVTCFCDAGRRLEFTTEQEPTIETCADALAICTADVR